ncbi:LysE family translocator [Segnochrobactrum spirostomi]|uniref:LysE family translocator n=1 Tax=Segnochrobactrum spirostomi TaxID=2608987 RepID=A0A6A7Y587_9HYPH|nr:LysE family translocator [Segnochrobactrum spirostomi]MQT13926.1 LysE family translocator [Segnochrobactrum spirostomi]
MSFDFLLTSLIVIVSPGTGVVITVAAGLSRGARGSLVAAFGCTLGIVPHLVAAISGLAALLHASGVAFEIVRWLGVLYLLVMAWQTLRDTGTLRIAPEAGPARSAGRVIVAAILANLLNPKLSLFFLAFLPQFVAPAGPGAVAQMLVLGLAFMAMTFAVFALYGLFAAAARDHILSRPRTLAVLRGTFAAAFVALGAKLALTR